ncbi:MAG: cytochrome ubiquinol oxidase subunit I [Nitrospira sp.]|nr:cytochrome ubiquinol oxidase subunit I [Nitrospira sp.]
MDLEPLHLPMLYGRLAIAAAALTHALCATFIVGSSMIGAATETIGYLTRNPRFERLARLIAFTLIFTTAGVSFLGVTLVFVLNIFWPQFWSTLFHIMFWPLLLEASFFLAEAVFAYLWYYSWDWSNERPGRKRWHLLYGWSAAASSLIAMLMIDIVASYMLTPRPPNDTWATLLNPTMIYLDTHRIVGNLTWTGFGLAALCAVGHIRSRTEEDRTFYRWAGAVCFTIGFGTLLIMPAIGYQYLLKVRHTEPQAFYTLMLGARSWLFDLVALIYSLLIVLGSVYIWRSLRPTMGAEGTARLVLPASLVVVTGAGLIFSLPYHLQHIPGFHVLTDQVINPLGKMQPYKYFAIACLVFFGLLNWGYFSRSFADRLPWWQRAANQRDRWSPTLLIALSFSAMLMMLTMGWSRETARAYNGYLIYGQITLEDERSTYDGTTPSSLSDGQIGRR